MKNMAVAIESAPKVSVLIAGWERLGDNPFRRKIEDYGCTTVHLPEDARVVPKCDLAVLAIRSASHGFTERVRKAYAAWERPVVWAKAGFEPVRADFESRLEAICKQKANQRRVLVREKSECPVARAVQAEEKIKRRELEMPELAVAKIENVPTVDEIVRRGYANRQSPQAIADEINRLGFRGGRGATYKANTVSAIATRLGCARKGSGKAAVAGVAKDEIIGRILSSSALTAEQKLGYIERVHRGQVSSLIDSGSQRDEKGALCLWRTPILEPERGVTFRITKAQACLIADHVAAIRNFAEEA